MPNFNNEKGKKYSLTPQVLTNKEVTKKFSPRNIWVISCCNKKGNKRNYHIQSYPQNFYFAKLFKIAEWVIFSHESAIYINMFWRPYGWINMGILRLGCCLLFQTFFIDSNYLFDTAPKSTKQHIPTKLI